MVRVARIGFRIHHRAVAQSLLYTSDDDDDKMSSARSSTVNGIEVRLHKVWDGDRVLSIVY